MMFKSLQDTTVIHNGVHMPWFGLGVFKVKNGEEAIQLLKTRSSIITEASTQRQFIRMKRVLGKESVKAYKK